MMERFDLQQKQEGMGEERKTELTDLARRYFSDFLKEELKANQGLETLSNLKFNTLSPADKLKILRYISGVVVSNYHLSNEDKRFFEERLAFLMMGKGSGEVI